jgi:hypothetical protein
MVPAEGFQSFSDLGISRQDRDRSAANTPRNTPAERLRISLDQNVRDV